MDIVILKTSADVAAEGARRIRALLNAKSDAVLGLATGATPLPMYRQLVADCQSGSVSFAEVTTFNLDEYVGLPACDKRSYRHYMQTHLFNGIDIDQNRTFLPACEPGADPLQIGPEYEAAIRRAGGIDLQVLGLGQNGHIGFNEPTSSLQSRTRVKTLTRETLAANARQFPDPNQQPVIAITMGIATIADARSVLMLATGASKAAAVQQMIEGPVSALWPATALQLHQTVTVLLDDAAAGQLEKRDYYEWISAQRLKLRARQRGAS